MNKQQREAYDQLGKHRHNLTRQQIRTLKGQIVAGDAEGALRGLERMIAEKNEGGCTMITPIKTSGRVQFDVLYADGTKRRAKEGVLFEADGDQMILHLGTSRPNVLFAVAEALTETIDAMGLSDAFLCYLKFTDEQKQEVQHEETADAGEPV